MLITVLYLTFYIVSNNAIISFIIILNIFYFFRELLFMKLFGTSVVQFITHENTEQMPLLKNESDILPDNIKQMLKNTVQPTVATLIPHENTVTEDPFITAILKAEKLVDKKIKELQERKPILHSEKSSIEKNLISESVEKAIKTEPKRESWDQWIPLPSHEKLLALQIYCEKCEKLVQLQETKYDITKGASCYELKTTHQLETEKHTNSVKITLDTFEILSKPTLLISQLQEAEA